MVGNTVNCIIRSHGNLHKFIITGAASLHQNFPETIRRMIENKEEIKLLEGEVCAGLPASSPAYDQYRIQKEHFRILDESSKLSIKKILRNLFDFKRSFQ